MRLTRLRLENVCQHRRLDWEFGAGLIGIFGENGAGKSNAMNLACYGAITNDYSRHVQNKPGMVRQHIGDEEKSEIVVDFVQDGHDYRIIRGLKSPVRHRLVCLPDGPEIKKANEIQYEMEAVLGIKRRLIDDYVFVDQDSLFAFLSESPAERARSFAHLCNTVKAEQIWNLLGEQISDDQAAAIDIDDTRDEIRQRIGEYKGKLSKIKKQMAAAKKRLLKESFKERCETIIKNSSSIAVLQGKLDIAAAEEPRLKKAAIEWRKARDAARDQLDAFSEEAENMRAARSELSERISTLRLQQQKYRNYSEVESEYEEAKQQRAAVESKQPDNPGHDIDDLRTEQIELQLDWHDAKQLIRGMETGACPTCGTTIEMLGSQVDEASEKIREVEPRLREIDKQIAEQRKADKAIAEAQQQRVAAAAVLAKAKKRFDAAEAVGPVDESEIEEAQESLDSIDKFLEREKDLKEKHSNAVYDFNRAKDKHQRCLSDCEDFRNDIKSYAFDRHGDELDLSAGSVQDAEDILKSHQEAASEINTCNARISDLEEFISSQEAEYDRASRRLARSGKAREWVRLLSALRDDVFHRDQLPSIVHQSYLQSMEEEIGKTLLGFNSPFHVTATDDIGLIARFRDGTEMPASGLSGGQKVMLAMAYRLTVNSLFASEVGMMILDEPTDGLDADNKALAAEVFREVGKVAKSRGHQVIVITHDEVLADCFDQRFFLERP